MDSPLHILSAFTGGYGLDLALERVLPRGRNVLLVEREAFAIEGLARKMEAGLVAPAPICTDIREVDGRAWHGLVDCVVGGFPCQDISTAGARAGIRGEKSGLWFELARVIRDVEPGLVFLENVSALTVRGLDEVLGSLAELRFDAEWGCLRASAVGFPHERNRWFCVAYAGRLGVAGLQSLLQRGGFGEAAACGGSEGMADAEDAGLGERRRPVADGAKHAAAERSSADVADDPSDGRREGTGLRRKRERAPWADCGEVADADRNGQQGERVGCLLAERNAPWRYDAHGRRYAPPPPGPDDAARWKAYLRAWPDAAPSVTRTQSELRGSSDGLASGLDPYHAQRIDRLRLLGNGVVPDQAEWAFRQLLSRACRG